MEMNYRNLGDTGLKISEVSFGTLSIPSVWLIDKL
jgi:aryl-alcohol dehydrogenase-like predicted oxidoreductase